MTSKEAVSELDCIITDYLCRLKEDNCLYTEDNGEDKLLDIIEEDLEVLEQFEILKNYYEPFKIFLNDMFEKDHNTDLTKIKEWLER